MLSCYLVTILRTKLQQIIPSKSGPTYSVVQSTVSGHLLAELSQGIGDFIIISKVCPRVSCILTLKDRESICLEELGR